MISTLIQLHAEYVMDRSNETKGTTTWFKCADGLPPKIDSNPFNYSIDVFVSDGSSIDIGPYCHNPAQGDPYWHIYSDWTPTHWAYINLPK